MLGKKNKKTGKKVVLGIIGVILIGIIVLVAWRWNDIKAAYYFISNPTSETITEKIEKTKEEREKAVSEYIEGTVRDFTEEEEKKITSGELTVEEATEIIKQEFENSVAKPEGETPKEKDKQEIDAFIAENIIQLYSYKAYYLGQLGQIEKAALADYRALPKKDRTLVSKQSIIDKYIGTANALLIECDGKVNGIIKKLEKKLVENKMDTSIVKQISKSYEEEKALKKAYYISLLKK
ncbi:MAG: hypothetical protein IJE44_03830 [Clostridia bacterium]|nr:hypothetical protein [Clostridia bacterium]